MTKDEMMKLFGIEENDTTEQIEIEDVSDSEATAAPSPHALTLDEWDKERGRKLSHDIRARNNNISAEAMADFHALAFLQRPKLEDGSCEDGRRKQFVEGILKSSEMDVLRHKTHLNSVMSEGVAFQFADQFAALQQADKQKQQQREKDKLPDTPRRREREAEEDRIQTMGFCQQALESASGSAEEMEGILSSMGCGSSAGGNNKMDLGKIQNTVSRVKGSKKLLRILDLAGRYRRVAAQKQRTKMVHGEEQLTGTELTDSIDKLLPEEAALLMEDGLEDEACRRLIEKEMIGYQYRSPENLGKGPIVVCVDESASMEGSSLEHAKAFALTMAWIAQKQKRYVCLVSFSSSSNVVTCVLKPSKWDQSKLLSWLEHFYRGGTSLYGPLETIPSQWAELGVPKGKTDMILLTDGVVSISQKLIDTYNEWKVKEKVKLITLVVGSSKVGQIPSVSDKVHVIPTLGHNQEGIVDCLSI